MVKTKLVKPYTKQFHLQFGEHSNIPRCCILYWWTTWIHFSDGMKFFLLRRHNWNYIPCEQCLLDDNRIEIHYCDISCIPYLRSINMPELQLEKLKNRKFNS